MNVVGGDKLNARFPRETHKKRQNLLLFGNAVPLKRRESPQFSKWFELLWKELNA